MNAAGHGEGKSRLTTYSGMDWIVFSGARGAAGLSRTRWFLVGSRWCSWYCRNGIGTLVILRIPHGHGESLSG